MKKKKILIGITGGIAAYKACSIVNGLLKKGAEVIVVMTESATKFITPLTFQAITNHEVYTDLWDIKNPNKVEHIDLAQWPDLILIAPATANTIAKVSAGISDNLLTTIVLASFEKTPIVFAPAMNTQMWNNKITQKNINNLRQYKKYSFIEPRSGLLACRDEGIGKIAETEVIIEIVDKILNGNQLKK